MNRIRVWIIPGIVVLLVLGSLLYFRGQLPEKSEPSKATVKVEVEVEDKTPKGFAKPPEPSEQEKAREDAAAMSAALRTGSLAECEKITWNQELKQQCIDNLNYASITARGDEAACQNLSDEMMRTKCLDKVFAAAAVKQQNKSLCEKIDNAALRQLCLDQVTALLARNADSLDDCAAISSDLLRTQCEDQFRMKTSAKDYDTSQCDDISDPMLAKQCRTTVTKNIEVLELSRNAEKRIALTLTTRQLLNECNKLTGVKATLCKDAVYPKLAFDEKDVSYCNQMSTQEKISQCLEDQGGKIDTYLFRQAVATDNSTLCNRISNAELKQTCLSS